MREEKEILYSSAEAAKYTTGIEGWVDSNGRFWGQSEHMARYSGCTHIDCKKCGAKIPVRGYTICDECREKKDVEEYNAMPREEWDGETPLYSGEAGEYFYDEDGLRDHMEEYGCDEESMRLVICRPVSLSTVDEDYFCDDLPEDGELPDAVAKAVDALNKVLMDEPPSAWFPGKYAAEIKGEK